jgi:proteasome lid subunit RPN8/RPN11
MENNSIFIPKKIIGEVILHSLRNDPNESCGVLQGSGQIVSKFHPIRNIHEAPQNRYTMDPGEQRKADDVSDDEGEKIIGIFHSHTHTQAYLSETDVKNALTSGYLEEYYVVVSLVEKTRPVLRAYKISKTGEITEVIVDFDGPKYISR